MVVTFPFLIRFEGLINVWVLAYLLKDRRKFIINQLWNRQYKTFLSKLYVLAVFSIRTIAIRCPVSAIIVWILWSRGRWQRWQCRIYTWRGISRFGAQSLKNTWSSIIIRVTFCGFGCKLLFRVWLWHITVILPLTNPIFDNKQVKETSLDHWLFCYNLHMETRYSTAEALSNFIVSCWYSSSEFLADRSLVSIDSHKNLGSYKNTAKRFQNCLFKVTECQNPGGHNFWETSCLQPWYKHNLFRYSCVSKFFC